MHLHWIHNPRTLGARHLGFGEVFEGQQCQQGDCLRNNHKTRHYWVGGSTLDSQEHICQRLQAQISHHLQSEISRRQSIFDRLCAGRNIQALQGHQSGNQSCLSGDFEQLASQGQRRRGVNCLSQGQEHLAILLLLPGRPCRQHQGNGSRGNILIRRASRADIH